MEHSSPLKRQINPETIHHSVFGVAVKSFNTLQVSFPSSNFAGEEIQLRALHKGLKIHVFVFITKKMLRYIKGQPMKVLCPVFPAPCRWQAFGRTRGGAEQQPARCLCGLRGERAAKGRRLKPQPSLSGCKISQLPMATQIYSVNVPHGRVSRSVSVSSGLSLTQHSTRFHARV